MPITNECETRVVGLQRSGNHAIINWLGSQYPGAVTFLNDVRCTTSNPFEVAASQKSPEFGLVFNDSSQHAGKGCLIYSYEDFSLEEVDNDVFDANHDIWLGTSKKRYDVLILRDPFNLFASRLKMELNSNIRTSLLSNTGKVVALWKAYAREYLGDTNYLKNNKVVISYNRWVFDAKYRRGLADKLSIPFSDKALNRVVPIGRGSSFDAQKFDLEAASMKILDRWQHFEYHPMFTSIFEDDDLIELSEEIFGPIKGTATLPELNGRFKKTVYSLYYKYAWRKSNRVDKLVRHITGGRLTC